MLSYYLALLRANKVWLKRTAWWAVFWCGAGILIVLVRPDTAERFLAFVQGVFHEILGGEEISYGWRTVWLIFRNNFEASLVVMFGGIILGLLPFLSLGINFFIVGYLLAFFVAEGRISGLLILLASVIPHGIVEIPIFIIAAAFGLRLGWFWRIEVETSNWKKLIVCLTDNVKLVPALAIGLFLAAIIEVFVSGALVSQM